jgi:hypothetical protein
VGQTLASSGPDNSETGSVAESPACSFCCIVDIFHCNRVGSFDASHIAGSGLQTFGHIAADPAFAGL